MSRNPKLGVERHRITWRHVRCRLVHTRNYLDQGWSQLEIEVVNPKDAPLPITETGYRAHYISEDDLVAAGGAIAFVNEWLDREAKTKRYAKAEYKWRQLTLF